MLFVEKTGVNTYRKSSLSILVACVMGVFYQFSALGTPWHLCRTTFHHCRSQVNDFRSTFHRCRSRVNDFGSTFHHCRSRVNDFGSTFHRCRSRVNVCGSIFHRCRSLVNYFRSTFHRCRSRMNDFGSPRNAFGNQKQCFFTFNTFYTLRLREYIQLVCWAD